MDARSQHAARLIRHSGGVMRMSEMLAAGINRKTLYAMVDAEILEKLSRGVYRLRSLSAMEAPDLVAISRRAPNGVICLISALAFHQLTTQIPQSIDLAIAKGSEKPRIDYPPVHIYWFSGKSFTEGIDYSAVDGQSVRIYSAEKSIADAFKYRNKIGLDVALEALKTWRQRKGISYDQLLEQARNCRVETVIRPYMETLA